MDLLNTLIKGLLTYFLIFAFIRYFAKLDRSKISNEMIMMMTILLIVILNISDTFDYFEDAQVQEAIIPTSMTMPVVTTGSEALSKIIPQPVQLSEKLGGSSNTPDLSPVNLSQPPSAAAPGSTGAPIGMIQAGQPLLPTQISFPNIAQADETKKVQKMDLITEDNSPLLAQDKDLSYIAMFDSSNKLDIMGNTAQYSLNCNSTYSSGAQGFMCLTNEGKNLLMTRGGNRGTKPISGEL